jgi:hypothetical protein
MAQTQAEKQAQDAKGADQPEAAAAAEAVAAEQKGEDKAAQKAEAKRADDNREAADGLLDRVGSMTREEIQRVHSFLDAALLEKGSDPPPRAASVKELAGALPLNGDETAKIDPKKAAKVISDSDLSDNADVELDADDVAAYAVRQGTAPNGDGVGPKFLVVSTTQGRKYAAAL